MMDTNQIALTTATNMSPQGPPSLRNSDAERIRASCMLFPRVGSLLELTMHTNKQTTSKTLKHHRRCSSLSVEDNSAQRRPLSLKGSTSLGSLKFPQIYQESLHMPPSKPTTNHTRKLQDVESGTSDETHITMEPPTKRRRRYQRRNSILVRPGDHLGGCPNEKRAALVHDLLLIGLKTEDVVGLASRDVDASRPEPKNDIVHVG